MLRLKMLPLRREPDISVLTLSIVVANERLNVKTQETKPGAISSRSEWRRYSQPVVVEDFEAVYENLRFRLAFKAL